MVVIILIVFSSRVVFTFVYYLSLFKIPPSFPSIEDLMRSCTVGFCILISRCENDTVYIVNKLHSNTVSWVSQFFTPLGTCLKGQCGWRHVQVHTNGCHLFSSKTGTSLYAINMTCQICILKYILSLANHMHHTSCRVTLIQGLPAKTLSFLLYKTETVGRYPSTFQGHSSVKNT